MREMLHGFDHGFRLDSLHADIISVARRFVRLIQTGAAKHLRVENIDVGQVLPVVFGVRGSEQANRWAFQGNRHVHRTCIVREDARRALQERKKFAEAQPSGAIKDANLDFRRQIFVEAFYESSLVGSSDQHDLIAQRNQTVDRLKHTLGRPAALQQQVRRVRIDDDIRLFPLPSRSFGEEAGHFHSLPVMDQNRSHEFALPRGDSRDSAKLQIELPHRHAGIEINEVRINALFKSCTMAVEPQSISRHGP